MADLHIKNKRFTEEEIEVIREKYPVGGSKLVIEYLKDRSLKSISEKARTLGIKCNNRIGKFTDEEIALLNEYYPIGGTELVKKHLSNRSAQVIYQKASELNLKTRKDLYTEQEDDFIIKHYPKGGYEEVMKFLPNRDKSSIQQRAFKLGVKYLSYDKDYFSKIDTEEKAYWLGFMYTDGYVTSDNRWGIELSYLDKSHIQKFLDAFDCNINIKDRIRNRDNKQFKSSSFQIKNKKMYDDLIDKGVLRNKTEIMKYPNDNVLPLKLAKHFIRGLFDGDGCYSMYSYQRLRTDRNNKLYDTTKYEISFVCKSKDFINKLCTVLNESIGLDLKVGFTKRDDLYTIKITNKESCIKFIDFLYSDSNIYLNRKHEKAVEIRNYCLA